MQTLKLLKQLGNMTQEYSSTVLVLGDSFSTELSVHCLNWNIKIWDIHYFLDSRRTNNNGNQRKENFISIIQSQLTYAPARRYHVDMKTLNSTSSKGVAMRSATTIKAVSLNKIVYPPVNNRDDGFWL